MLLLGIFLLLAGGAALVSGASRLAAGLGVSPALVGLTVVAFGTSAPELVVNVIGALRNETSLAFGNVAGSNLANLGLVLGTAAMLRPVTIGGQIVRRELPLLMLGIYKIFLPEPGVDIWYVAGWLLVMWLGWTMLMIPYYAWGAELSTDYDERTRVTGWRAGRGQADTAT